MDALDTYCRQMSQHGEIKGLTPDETKLYFSRYEAISQQLSEDWQLSEKERKKLESEREQIVKKVTTSCLPYVLHLARDYAKGHEDPDLLMELVAAGNLGLCIAVPRFNHRIGTPFHFYASNWMKAEFRMVLKKHHCLVKQPRGHAVSVYIEGMTPTQNIPEALCEHQVELDSDLAQLEREEEVRTAVSSLAPVAQLIYRMREGLVSEACEKYTRIAEIFGEGVTTAFCKMHYNYSRKLISATLLNSVPSSPSS